MKTLFLAIFFLSRSFLFFAQDVGSLQKEVERLESFNEELALQKCQEILKLQPANLVANCKSSELCSSIGHRQTIAEKKIVYFTSAKKYAEQALRINPNSSEANFVMAIAIGRMALLLNGREKIAAVDQIKKYAQFSIKCDPNNYKPYHVLARWHYEVSDLSIFERSVARLFYGGVPPASLKEAIYNYEKCRSLVPDLKVNYLELAKCYHRNDEPAKAFDMLKRAIAMPDKIQDDKRVKEEAKELLKKWE